MPYEPPPELSGLSLAEVAELVAARKLPPVSQWEPSHIEDSHMRIASDGRWYHEGSAIRRPAMVRAFASLLTRNEDGAFIAVDLKREGSDIAFRLNTDDLVIAGPDHPIRSHGDPDTPALYLGVRNGTEARLNRSTYAQLVEIALEQDALAVTSGGATFSLIPA